MLRTLANSSSSRSSNTGTGRGLKVVEVGGILVVFLLCVDSLSLTIRNSGSSLIDNTGSRDLSFTFLLTPPSMSGDSKQAKDDQNLASLSDHLTSE